MNALLPVGVFDSGLGGLTVVRAVRRTLPNESILYLGDTARVPYGTRSASTVVRYARGCARLLTERGVKALVIACNTVSAVALEMLRAEVDLPILGVIQPGAEAAVQAAILLEKRSGRAVHIGVLGTVSTVASGAYPRAVAALSTRLEVDAAAAPLLVPLVEEGWLSGDVPRLAIERYLAPLLERSVRVLVLGCTHYPLLKPLIEEVAQRLAGEEVVVVDSAEATASALSRLLDERGLLGNASGSLQLMVTDLPGSFAATASRFLGEPVATPDQVDITLG